MSRFVVLRKNREWSRGSYLTKATVRVSLLGSLWIAIKPILLGVLLLGTNSVQAQGPQTPSQAEDSRVYWPRFDFVIPYNVEQSGQTPREIVLETSNNGGRTWAVYSRSDVRTKQFQFLAIADGEYLFRLKTLDSQGRSFDNPGEPLAVVVDTIKPEANLVIEIDPKGIMLAEFAIADLALDASTVQLTYQTESMNEPAEIVFDLQQDQETLEWLGTGSWELPVGVVQLSVRLTAKDRAGNQVEVNRLPKLYRSANVSTGLQFASGKSQEPRFANNAGRSETSTKPIGSGIALPSPDTLRQDLPKIEVLGGPGKRQSPTTTDSHLTTAVVERQQQLIEQLVQQKQYTQEQILKSGILNANSANKASSQNGLPSRGLTTEAPASTNSKTKAMSDEEFQRALDRRQMSLTSSRADQPNQSLLIGDQDPNYLPMAPAGLPSGPTSVREDRPVERIPGQTSFRNNIKPLFSRAKSFSLEYTVENDPDSPVAAVELWGTTDEGLTWQVWGEDPDRASPFDIQVETEGLFGFRMIIVGANGLASNRPRNGDNADAWIHVDTELPQARITSALYGKGKESGSLVIEYRVADEYLPERPIVLSYSETPEGPWNVAASGVRNQGRYVWPADPSLPPTIYLKLEAYDLAGNVAVHRLESPIEVQGLAPRGLILGLRPIP
jgi:hypothetical protein